MRRNCKRKSRSRSRSRDDKRQRVSYGQERAAVNGPSDEKHDKKQVIDINSDSDSELKDKKMVVASALDIGSVSSTSSMPLMPLMPSVVDRSANIGKPQQDSMAGFFNSIRRSGLSRVALSRFSCPPKTPVAHASPEVPMSPVNAGVVCSPSSMSMPLSQAARTALPVNTSTSSSTSASTAAATAAANAAANAAVAEQAKVKEAMRERQKLAELKKESEEKLREIQAKLQEEQEKNARLKKQLEAETQKNSVMAGAALSMIKSLPKDAQTRYCEAVTFKQPCGCGLRVTPSPCMIRRMRSNLLKFCVIYKTAGRDAEYDMAMSLYHGRVIKFPEKQSAPSIVSALPKKRGRPRGRPELRSAKSKMADSLLSVSLPADTTVSDEEFSLASLPCIRVEIGCRSTYGSEYFPHNLYGTSRNVRCASSLSSCQNARISVVMPSTEINVYCENHSPSDEKVAIPIPHRVAQLKCSGCRDLFTLPMTEQDAKSSAYHCSINESVVLMYDLSRQSIVSGSSSSSLNTKAKTTLEQLQESLGEVGCEWIDQESLKALWEKEEAARKRGEQKVTGLADMIKFKCPDCGCAVEAANLIIHHALFVCKKASVCCQDINFEAIGAGHARTCTHTLELDMGTDAESTRRRTATVLQHLIECKENQFAASLEEHQQYNNSTINITLLDLFLWHIFQKAASPAAHALWDRAAAMSFHGKRKNPFEAAVAFCYLREISMMTNEEVEGADRAANLRNKYSSNATAVYFPNPHSYMRSFYNRTLDNLRFLCSAPTGSSSSPPHQTARSQIHVTAADYAQTENKSVDLTGEESDEGGVAPPAPFSAPVALL